MSKITLDMHAWWHFHDVGVLFSGNTDERDNTDTDNGKL